MSNLTDFGVSADALNGVINPARSPNSYWIGPALTGDTGTGNATGQFTTSQSFRTDQYNDFDLVIGSSRRLITSTSGAVLTVDGAPNLTAYAGAAYSIEAHDAIGTTQAVAVVERIVGEIKSALPERYRRMLTQIEGEMVVRWAAHRQATTTTTYQIASADQLYLWRNLTGPYDDRSINHAMYSPLDVTNGLANYADYSVGTASPTVITFQLGGNTQTDGRLAKGDMIVADYTHSLPTVPRLLHKIALHKSAYEILWQMGMGEAAIPEAITAYKTEADTLLTALRDGTAGIDEFDQIRLYTETRGSAKPGGYFSAYVPRG